MTPGQHSGGRQRLATSIVACLGIAGLLATALMIQATPALAQGPASAPANAVGQAKVVVRFVYGTVAATRESLKVEDSVYWQELIETGEASAGKMVFLDGTTLSTGPNARVRIDEFVYAGNNQAERVVVSIGRGVARFVTGGSPSSTYSIRTPNAIIGVRGTDFTVLVDDQGGTSVQVHSGQVVMTTADAAPVIVSAGESYSLGAPGTVVPMQGAVPEPSPMKPAPAPVSAPASDPVVGATPPPRPAANQEPLPAEQLEAATAEIEAMLMIEGEGDRAAMNSDAELLQLSGRKGLAASSSGGDAGKPGGAELLRLLTGRPAPARWRALLMLGLMLIAVGGCAGTSGNERAPKTGADPAAPDPSTPDPSTTAINGIPLPPGHWQAIDAGDQEVGGGTSRRIIYVSTVRGIVDRVVLVRRMTLGLRYQFQPRRSCTDPGYFYQQPEQPLPKGGECWHVRAVNLGLAGDPHWLNRALDEYADGQDLYLPVVMLGPRFVRYQEETLVQVDYLWNADVLLPPPAGTAWQPQDWSNAAIAADPAKGAVMSTLVRWSRQWQPRLEPAPAAG